MPLPAALLSLQSHGDRSFLDDSMLALVSGDLRRGGFENDLVVCALDPKQPDQFERDWSRLRAALKPFSTLVYERVWNSELVQRLRRDCPDMTFVQLVGEHALTDAPADYRCGGDLRDTVPALFEYLTGVRDRVPQQVSARQASGEFAVQGAFIATSKPIRARPFAPNLRPLVVNPEAMPTSRVFSIDGNGGCPYQADARDNPLYAGVTIPKSYGLGCAFCTTGNHFEGLSAQAAMDKVLEQVQYLRGHAPELDTLVLRDQNPAAYLAELVERCAADGLSGFALLLETRGDWFLRNRKRFERALHVAAHADIAIAPFLVGIENFSQPELDRFNKGIDAAVNEEFLRHLWRWDERFTALDLSHASFGFVLLSPWTTLADLRCNLVAVRRTQLHRLRGRLLLSRARLYPDTALYYLAKKDNLLLREHADAGDDASARYGYFPSTPWKFADPVVGHYAHLAAQLTETTGGRDELAMWTALQACFDGASAPLTITQDDVIAHMQASEHVAANRTPAKRSDARGQQVRERFADLVAPMSMNDAFGDGWHFGDLTVQPGLVRIVLTHTTECDVTVELIAHAGDGVTTSDAAGRHIARSRHYLMRVLGREALTASQQQATTLVCAAVSRNDV